MYGMYTLCMQRTSTERCTIQVNGAKKHTNTESSTYVRPSVSVCVVLVFFRNFKSALALAMNTNDPTQASDGSTTMFSDPWKA